MNSEAANAPRCQDRPGSYEAWYVTVSDPPSRRGFWLRYTTMNPASGTAADAHSALRAFAFARDHPETTWGLRWESREPPFPFLRPRWQALASVANIGAQPALSVSGTVELNGRVHRLDAAPGGQQHTWGSAHALAWNWGFASGADFWVDGATSRVRSRFGRVIVGTAVGAHAGAHTFMFNGPVHVLRNRGPISPDGWRATARLGDRTLAVVIKPRLEDLIGVTYDDPRGGSRYCYHTEVADLDLRLTRGSELLAHVNRPASAAFEYASETPLAGVPLTT